METSIIGTKTKVKKARMRLSLREEIRHIPGSSQVLRTPIREWICPECDYFEEADGENA